MIYTRTTFTTRLDRFPDRRTWRASAWRACSRDEQAARRDTATAASPEVPQFPAQGEAQYCAVHGGRPIAARHVRSQAGAAEVSGAAARSVDLRTERTTGGLLPSPFEFKQYGAGGVHVSSLLPNLASTIDDICVIKSMYTFNPTHTPGAQSLSYRQHRRHPAFHGRVDLLRSRHREQEPARFRRAESRPGRRRRVGARRLPSRQTSGHHTSTIRSPNRTR